MKRGLWGTRFGFYLASIGSAFGLGNLWRFPYVTVENGGGAFVLIYFFAALLIGTPLLIGELMLGKLSRRSSLLATEKLVSDSDLCRQGGAKWVLPCVVWAGRVSAVACILVFSYYAVISGWVLHFLMQFLTAEIRMRTFVPERTLVFLMASGPLQIALTSAHLLIAILVVSRGVQEGIEKWVGNLMPVFVGLLLILAGESLMLPSAPAAIRFLFYPDFTRLSWSSLEQAIGHVCFTLSLGFGTMVTFGSYLNEETFIPAAGLKVTLVDTMISLFAGLLIFPIALASPVGVSGPNVLFLTVPKLLISLPYGAFFGISFFLCLYIAALGASIGLLESIVSNLMEKFKWKREKAAWVAGFVALCLGAFPALSTSIFSSVSVRGRGLLEILDGTLINVVLPLSALGMAVSIVLRLRLKLQKSEFINDSSLATEKLWSHWLFVMRFLGPATIALALGLGIFHWFIR